MSNPRPTPAATGGNYLDSRGLVRLFGGRSRLLQLLTKHGYILDPEGNPAPGAKPALGARQLTVKAIDRWVERGSIPSFWLTVMLDIFAKEEGRHLDLRQFRRGSRLPDNTPPR